MFSKTLMISSAAIFALLGLAMLFLPQELLAHFKLPLNIGGVLLVQTAAALMLGFAFMNWMARGSMIGGIYSRPVTVGNLAHFTIGSLVLLKIIFNGNFLPGLVGMAVIYAVFAVGFGVLLYRHPAQPGSG